MLRDLTHLRGVFPLPSSSFFFFLVFLTALTLINSKNNYSGCVLRLAEENLEGMPGLKKKIK